MALIEFVVSHPWRAVAILVLGVLLGTGAFYAYSLSTAISVVASEDFDPEGARDAIAGAPLDTTPTTYDFEIEEPAFTDEAELEVIESTLGSEIDPRQLSPNSFGDPIPDDVFESYLLVGTDAGGVLADVIILALQPSGGGAPVVVSLPRDLYVWNLCRGSFTRLNTGLVGCKGTASGSELMAIMVEDYTGIPVDHLARINFDGFARLVNAMGGVTICVDYPTRDPKSGLDITETGCQTADGATALAWVRSRSTEQLQGGEWVRVAGSDFARQGRQQDILFQLAAKAGRFSSPASLADKLAAVSSMVRLDSSWSFGQAVSAGWRYRGITQDSVNRFSISVKNYRTSAGASVLLPTEPFQAQLAPYASLG